MVDLALPQPGPSKRPHSPVTPISSTATPNPSTSTRISPRKKRRVDPPTPTSLNTHAHVHNPLSSTSTSNPTNSASNICPSSNVSPSVSVEGARWEDSFNGTTANASVNVPTENSRNPTHALEGDNLVLNELLQQQQQALLGGGPGGNNSSTVSGGGGGGNDSGNSAQHQLIQVLKGLGSSMSGGSFGLGNLGGTGTAGGLMGFAGFSQGGGGHSGTGASQGGGGGSGGFGLFGGATEGLLRSGNGHLDAVRMEIGNINTRITALESFRYQITTELGQIKASLNSLSNRLGVPISNPVPSHNAGMSMMSQEIAQLIQSLPPEVVTSLKQAMDAQLEGAEDGNEDGVGENVVGEDDNEDIPIAPELMMDSTVGGVGTARSTPSFMGSTSTNIASTSRKRNVIMPALSTNGEKVKGHRRAELSRAVRSTMFTMLGFSGTSRFHGYSPSPVLPDFDTSERYDPSTGQKIWRWEWSKTLRQSQNNAAFAAAIARQVQSDRRLKAEWTDVPEGDWKFVDEAVESAYTNLRREREAQVDPVKMKKKKEHRVRNKKRGLKEEKMRRRKRNWEEMKKERLEEGVVIDGVEEEELMRALDIKYMSSEEESPEAIPESGTLIHKGTTGEKDKTFLVCKPGWRSQTLQRFFNELDEYKTLERAYTRYEGEVRKVEPPKGTPAWMIQESWEEEEE